MQASYIVNKKLNGFGVVVRGFIAGVFSLGLISLATHGKKIRISMCLLVLSLWA